MSLNWLMFLLPLVPADAGTQSLPDKRDGHWTGLDSRFRGNERMYLPQSIQPIRLRNMLSFGVGCHFRFFDPP